MSVKVRRFKYGGWEVDIRLTLPDGAKIRRRRKAPCSSKSAALRWGEQRVQSILAHSQPQVRKEVPTLTEFTPRFLEGYAEANRQKPSGIAAKETIFRIHLIPHLGRKRLNDISNEDIQRLKGLLRDRAPKTINNILSVLSTALKIAMEWGVIDQMPCTIRALKDQPKEAKFHDFDEYNQLIEAAKRTDRRAHLIVLLGGDAGLRCGEIMALEFADIDFQRRQLHVQRSDWRGKVTVPKGNRTRRIPLTTRLSSALQANRHLKSKRVVCESDGNPMTQRRIQILVRNSAKLANLANEGVHILRHTFCSHLAMRSAPPTAIQKLAGHRDLSTTQRYMHLSPAAVEGAIKLLECHNSPSIFGDILETRI